VKIVQVVCDGCGAVKPLEPPLAELSHEELRARRLGRAGWYRFQVERGWKRKRFDACSGACASQVLGRAALDVELARTP
jgi:hypothetical protein